MSGHRWEEYSLNEKNINLKIYFFMMKYITLLILLFSLTSCFQDNNKNKTEGPQFDEIMNLLHERSLKQMRSIPNSRYYFQQSPIIEALIETDTTNRTLREKMKAAYERTQEMSDSERDAILESYQKIQNGRE